MRYIVDLLFEVLELEDLLVQNRLDVGSLNGTNHGLVRRPRIAAFSEHAVVYS